MTQVDFYILPDNSTRERFACAIANKAWLNGKRVYIRTASREAADVMDDLLWTFRDTSFLPHAMAGAVTHPSETVIVGWADQQPADNEIFINLTQDIPATAEDYDRIVEIVTGDIQQRENSRKRYRAYRERGYELHNHTIKSDYDDA
jgi:DNA polymerase III, chi subunit